MAAATNPAEPAAAEIKAIPVRHPGRWVASAVVLLLSAMFVHMLFTNDAFQWQFIRDNAFSEPVMTGARNTLILTALSMFFGITLGIVLAVMRLSPNPVLSGGAWVYVWFFRAVPRVVLLILFGNLGVLYAQYDVGIPFDRQIADLFGLSFDGRFFGVSANTILTAFVAALLGLGAVRGRLHGRDRARRHLLGRRGPDRGGARRSACRGCRTMRRIVLPQAMRVIIPPTGNETITMLKDTVAGRVVAVLRAALRSCRPSARRPSSSSRCWSWRASGTWPSPACSRSASTSSSGRFAPGHPTRHRTGRPQVPLRGPAAAAERRSGRMPSASDDRRRWSRPRRVHKRFGALEVLKGIDLEVEPGEVMCSIGPSGSGKSTFLRCINHLEKIDAGRLCGRRRAGRLPRRRATSSTS